MTQNSADPALPVSEGGECAEVAPTPADATPKLPAADCPAATHETADTTSETNRQSPSSEKPEAQTATPAPATGAKQEGEQKESGESEKNGGSEKAAAGSNACGAASASPGKKEEKGETTTSTAVRVHRWADESDDLDSPSFDPLSSAEMEPPEFDLGMPAFQRPGLGSSGNGIVPHAATQGGYRRGMPGQSPYNSGGYGGLVDSRFGGLVGAPHAHHGPPAGPGDALMQGSSVASPFTEVYVADLDANVTEEDVSVIFAPSLSVRSVRLVREPANRGNKGGPNATCGAYVAFHSPEDAQRALSFHGKLYRPPRGSGASQGLRGSRQAGSFGGSSSARVLRILPISSPPLLGGDGGAPPGYLLSRGNRGAGPLGGHYHSSGSPHLLQRGGRGAFGGGVYGQAVADLVHQQASSVPSYRGSVSGSAPGGLGGPGPHGRERGKLFPGEEAGRGERGREADGKGVGGAGVGAGRRKKSRSPDFSELRKETGGLGAGGRAAGGVDTARGGGGMGPRGPGASGDKSEETPAAPEPPRERPKLLLKPRTKPLDATTEPTNLNPAIFGAAKPIDDPVAKRQLPAASGGAASPPASSDPAATPSAGHRASTSGGPRTPRGENSSGGPSTDVSSPGFRRGEQATKGRAAPSEKPAEKETRAQRGSGASTRGTGSTEDGRQKGRVGGGAQKGAAAGEEAAGAHASHHPGRERGEKERDERGGARNQQGLYSGPWRRASVEKEKDTGDEGGAGPQAPHGEDEQRRTSGVAKSEAPAETERKPTARTGDPFGGARPRDEFEWQRKKEAAASPVVLPDDAGVRVSPLQHPPLSPYLPHHGSHPGRQAGFLPPSYASAYTAQSELGSHPGALGVRAPDESARTPPSSATPDAGNSSRGILGPSPSARGGSGASPSGAQSKGANPPMRGGSGALAPAPVGPLGPGGPPGSPALKSVAQTPPCSGVSSSLQRSPNASPSIGPGIWGRSLQGPLQKTDGAPARGAPGGRASASAGAQEPLWRSSVASTGGPRPRSGASAHVTPTLFPGHGAGRGVFRPPGNSQGGEGLLSMGSGDGVLAAPATRGDSEERLGAQGAACPSAGGYHAENNAHWARKPQNPIQVRGVQTVVLSGGEQPSAAVSLIGEGGTQDRGALETGRRERAEPASQDRPVCGMRSLAEQLLPAPATSTEGKARPADEKAEEETKKKEAKVLDILSKPEQKQGQTVWEARNEVLGLDKREVGPTRSAGSAGERVEQGGDAPHDETRRASNALQGEGAAASTAAEREGEGQEGEGLRASSPRPAQASSPGRAEQRGEGETSASSGDVHAEKEGRDERSKGRRGLPHGRGEPRGPAYAYDGRGRPSTGSHGARGSEAAPGDGKREDDGRRNIAGNRERDGRGAGDSRGGRGGRTRGGGEGRMRWRRYTGEGGDATPSERMGDDQAHSATGDQRSHADAPEAAQKDGEETPQESSCMDGEAGPAGEKGRRGESQASSVHDYSREGEKAFRRRGGERGRGGWRGGEGRPEGAGRGRGTRGKMREGVGMSNGHQPGGRHGAPGHRREHPGGGAGPDEERGHDSQVASPRV
ncbi:putative alpha-1 type II collagen [Neospora caninum Liverpool]|nr:putative alpha-1 type II collagen [Neospora caninum Liverpool]CBZ50926.1 putative alpha-1 type II collagen [Neospora caninum Liverpool]|eukprot:XP_003880959.1 putative alpha-1 type II collagen [Neospora caninum Liverpool]